MHYIREFFTSTVAGWRMINAPPGAWIAEEFLLRLGIECNPQPLPTRYSKMMPHACFQNTAALVRRYRRTLRYCEGYVMLGDGPISIHHAWAIDCENNVIDPTLTEPEKYLFLGFPISMAERRLWVRPPQCLSVLENMEGRNIQFMIKHCPDLIHEIDRKYWKYLNITDNTVLERAYG